MASASTTNAALAPIILESGDVLKIQTANANVVEGIVSYLEIFDEKSP